MDKETEDWEAAYFPNGAYLIWSRTGIQAQSCPDKPLNATVIHSATLIKMDPVFDL